MMEMAEQRAPVNGLPRGTIAWSEHLKAWEAYHRRHTGQSAERIAERGGFGLEELADQLGYLPRTWLPDSHGIERMARYGVTPLAAPSSLDAAESGAEQDG